MITISPISAATLETRFGGYRKGHTIANSSWKGEMSAYFRLEDSVEPRTLVSLFKGYTPDGKVAFFSEKIREEGPGGWHLNFTAPITVRNLWALAPVNYRTSIEESQQFAAAYCLHSLERSLRGPENGRLETQIPGTVIAVVPSEPLKQTFPQLETDAFMANLHLPIHGVAQRCPLLPGELQNKSAHLNALYNKKLCERLHWSLGLEFIQESSKEAKIVGVPESLDFSKEQTGKWHDELSRLLHSPESLKFQEWQSRVEDQGWSKKDAKALLQFSREKKSIWSTFEKATLERLEKSREELEAPKKVTKTLFKTTTMTHSY